jgi:hypothetical protein
MATLNNISHSKKKKRKLPSMKRKRPWAAAPLSAWISFSVLLLTILSAPAAVDSSSVFRVPVEAETNLKSNITKTPAPVLEQIEKDYSPFLFDMKLNVTIAVDFNDLLRKINTVVEFYLFDQLYGYALDVDYVDVRSISLQVTLLVRRRRQLQLSADNTKIITVEVDGAAHYYVDASKLDMTQVKSDINVQVLQLLTMNNVGQNILNNKIDNVVQVNNFTVKNYFMGEDDGDDDNDSQQTSNTDTGNALNDENKLKKPSDLSIVLGFTLLGLMVASLLGYIWLFCRKRKKRMVKQKQLKNKISPNQPIVAPSPQKPTKRLDNDAPPFSRKQKYQKAVDSFTNKQETDSQQQQTWSDFLDLNNDSKEETNQFTVPYGGNKLNQSDDISNWEPYGNRPTEEKTEDDWGTASAFSAANTDSSAPDPNFDLNLSNVSGTSSTSPSVVSSEASTMMTEVQKLQRYVQRYEKRKERRTQREQASKSQISSATDDLDFDYMKRVKTSLSSPSRLSASPSRFSAAASRASAAGRHSYNYSRADDDTNSSIFKSTAVRDNTSLKKAGANLTSQLLGKSKLPNNQNHNEIGKSRLGISPFKQSLASFDRTESQDEFKDAGEVEEGNRRRTKSDGDRPAYNNLKSLRNYQAIMDNKKRLKDLRKGNAIIDSSKSDVNIGSAKPFSTASQPPSPIKTFSTKPNSIPEEIVDEPYTIKPETPHLLLLMSGLTTNPQDRANQDLLMTLIKTNGFEDPEILDGSDLKFKDRRNDLFNISGIFAKYPQLFAVLEDQEPTFVGDFEMVQELNDLGQFTSRVVFAPPRTTSSQIMPQVNRRFSAPKARTYSNFTKSKIDSNSNANFSSARNMFENKPQNAIFPPGQRLF